MESIEYFPIVDESGQTLGKASRKECHSGSFLLHPVVHLHVFNLKGAILLQKRSLNKDIQPGKWDTSVGGHVDYGEEIIDALKREAMEELEIAEFDAEFIKKYKFTSTQESELVHVFITRYDGRFKHDPGEISETRFWTIEEVISSLNKNIFTPNFEQEFVNTILPYISKQII